MAEMIQQKSYARKPFARERRLAIQCTVVVNSIEQASLVPGEQLIEVGKDSHKRLSASKAFATSAGKFCPVEECKLSFKSSVVMRDSKGLERDVKTVPSSASVDAKSIPIKISSLEAALCLAEVVKAPSPSQMALKGASGGVINVTVSFEILHKNEDDPADEDSDDEHYAHPIAEDCEFHSLGKQKVSFGLKKQKSFQVQKLASETEDDEAMNAPFDKTWDLGISDGVKFLHGTDDDDIESSKELVIDHGWAGVTHQKTSFITPKVPHDEEDYSGHDHTWDMSANAAKFIKNSDGEDEYKHDTEVSEW